MINILGQILSTFFLSIGILMPIAIYIINKSAINGKIKSKVIKKYQPLFDGIKDTKNK